jgi:glycosyltransferase involved in cell wall biosynthesis
VPSLYEGFGYAAAWALCAGVPVVAARASSLPEVVGTGGVLVEPTGVAAWQDAIAAILADPAGARARAAAGRPAAIARFSWGASAAAAASCYARALAAG